jgi:hypothetical protein
MTPRNEHSTLTDLLIQQMHSKLNEFDLRQRETVVTLLPPTVLKAKFEGGEAISGEKEGYKLSYFQNSADAQAFSSLKAKKGTPAALGLFLQEKPEEALFEFSPLGFCFFSKKKSYPQKAQRESLALFAWVHYALSPELWGSQGKWVRFHQRLHTLFSEKNLLQGPDYTGHYPLKKTIMNFESQGLLGDESGDAIVLTIPWSFSLSSLQKLEQMLK